MAKERILAVITALICLALVAPYSGIGEEVSGVEIVLSDDGITVDGVPVSEDSSEAVYISNDIIYYEADQGFTYGEGTEADEHDPEEAEAHTVVNICKAGTYIISGKLSAGQISVDLGEDAEDDPQAVVTLILNGVDIECTVAPAIIFYNVYECGTDDEDEADMNVDTSSAGANIVIADGSVNDVRGSYVARIYKSYTLNDEGTEVVDNKKLHKYDGAVYSKMSMNVSGGGTLNIYAENEGLDSELHLTINGGVINIESGNDGINTNEDGISVTTINDGILNIVVNGSTEEGDGIDSNGWIVINGGTVYAYACSNSGDSGTDADNGTYINGGTIVATGNMYDPVNCEQNSAVFSFSQHQSGGNTYSLRGVDGSVFNMETKNGFTYLLFSSPDMSDGEYTIWCDDQQLQAATSDGGAVGNRPGRGKLPALAENGEGVEPPEDMKPGEGAKLPDERKRPEPGKTDPEAVKQDEEGGADDEKGAEEEKKSEELEINNGLNFFSVESTGE